MSETLKLSSIIVARDEEKNIGRCLKSLDGIFDDIVVVIDSRTTDSTYQAASSFKNVNCEFFEWQGYSKTKTYALSKTKNDWVLWIDADEELTPELVEELKDFKKKTPLFNSYEFARRAFFLGKWIKHSGWYPSRVTRLFNKQKIHFDEREVHEGLVIKGEIGRFQNDLNHYTDPTIEHYFSKFNKYTTLAAAELNEKGKRAVLNDIVLRPVFLFVKMYIFRLGFLDGINGLILAVFSSAYVFTKYSKLWELNRKSKT